ncbi:MAG: hypothetical protein AAGG02_01790 [Cyanobacteria bacterium P01_H01_bin.15]
MESEKLSKTERAAIAFRAGRLAFESGAYRQSVDDLERAVADTPVHLRRGGEVRLWLVNAYQAAGQGQDAIALCQRLCGHGDLEIRRQSKSLLYILQAPKLERPAEWMTQIPDLGGLSVSAPQDRKGSNPIKKGDPDAEWEAKLAAETNVTAFNDGFIWVVLGGTLLLLAGVIWL